MTDHFVTVRDMVKVKKLNLGKMRFTKEVGYSINEEAEVSKLTLQAMSMKANGKRI